MAGSKLHSMTNVNKKLSVRFTLFLILSLLLHLWCSIDSAPTPCVYAQDSANSAPSWQIVCQISFFSFLSSSLHENKRPFPTIFFVLPIVSESLHGFLAYLLSLVLAFLF